MSKITQLALLFAGTALLCATPSFAQATRSDAADAEMDDEPRPDDLIVTASGIQQPRIETGQSISVIDRDRLDSLQAISITDALRTLPGVQAVTRGTVGSQSSVFIRGSNSSQTLVLVDGVRINDQSSPNGAFDFGALLTGNIDRVELLRGPNSIIWGSQAIGGVVNVQSAIPTTQFAARAGAEYGTHDTARANLNLSGTSGILQGSVGASYYTTDGISALVGGTERDGYENVGANGRLVINLTDAFNLDFRGYYNRGVIEFDSPFGAGANALPVSRNRQFVGYVGANIALADGRFRNRIAYARTDIARLGTDPVVFSFNNFDVAATVNRFEYHGAFDVNDAITVVFGAEHERTFSAVSFEGAPADIARTRVTSGFMQAIVQPFTGLTLTGGVRHDDYSSYGGQTTLGGNIAYTPNDGATVLRATYGEGFRAPTLSEGQPPFGNTALRPETARNLDVGIEQVALGGAIRASVTYFRRRSTDQIGFSFNTLQPENIDQVYADGFEFALVLRPTNRLDVGLAYTDVDATIGSRFMPGPTFPNGNRLPLRPKHNASVIADWTSPWGFSLGATVLMVGDSFDNALNSVRIDGYALASVRASVPLTTSFELFGRVENLLDANYQNVAGYGTYGRTFSVGVRARL